MPCKMENCNGDILSCLKSLRGVLPALKSGNLCHNLCALDIPLDVHRRLEKHVSAIIQKHNAKNQVYGD